jgi:formamidopyrimidine-DNA glycosylase
MPELPEVETSRRGISPYVVGRRVKKITIRQHQLRWPISAAISRELPGLRIDTLERRAKYLLFRTTAGTMLLHLGMSGRLHIVDRGTPASAHDHVDIEFDNKRLLRFNDPRRFGSILWTRDPEHHRLLRHLGPEPLEAAFDGDYLWRKARGRKVAIKQFIMNAGIVVGVGNIYASESLFRAGIDPRRQARRISKVRANELAAAIREVLAEAIQAGGTTLRDFLGSDGEPGYFKQDLRVYDRENVPCRECGAAIRRIVQGQRATYFCSVCQR